MLPSTVSGVADSAPKRGAHRVRERQPRTWDALDATYFAGYAWWNYLSPPILLAHDGVTITEGDVRPEAGEPVATPQR
jgi:hypothetical protein